MLLQDPESDYMDAALITVMQIHLTEPEGDILLFLTGGCNFRSCPRTRKCSYMLLGTALWHCIAAVSQLELGSCKGERGAKWAPTSLETRCLESRGRWRRFVTLAFAVQTPREKCCLHDVAHLVPAGHEWIGTAARTPFSFNAYA